VERGSPEKGPGGGLGRRRSGKHGANQRNDEIGWVADEKKKNEKKNAQRGDGGKEEPNRWEETA